MKDYEWTVSDDGKSATMHHANHWEQGSIEVDADGSLTVNGPADMAMGVPVWVLERLGFTRKT